MNFFKKIACFVVCLSHTIISNAQCTTGSNIDFETGTYANWTYYTGSVAYLLPTYTVNWSSGIVGTPTTTYYHKLTPDISLSDPYHDYYGGFSTVAPGGSHSLKINSDYPSGNASKVRYTFTIPPGATSTSLVYRYALVIEDPGHPDFEQPRFEIAATNLTTNTPIACSGISLIAGAFTGYSLSSIPNSIFEYDIMYHDWQSGSINLTLPPGTSVAVDFAVSNCSQTQHFAYAYIDMDCGTWTNLMNACCPGTTTLPTAPPGFAYHKWYKLPDLTTSLGSDASLPSFSTICTTTTFAVVMDNDPSFACAETLYVDVNPIAPPDPGTIVGPSNLCAGSNATYSSPTGAIGGTWTSSNTAVATVGPTTGIVSGLSAGVCIISYTVSNPECGPVSATKTITVNPTPAAITGTLNACVGLSTTLSDATPGGVWASSDPSIAAVSGGVVTGVSVGTATITYTLPAGCYVTATVTVNTEPSAIGGITRVCLGSTTTLTDATSGGTWTSSNTAVASVGLGTGVVSGVSLGVATISYTLPSGCYVTTTVTVVPVPTAISGSTSVCSGFGFTLTDGVSGGTWSSSNSLIASVNPVTGLVTGVSAGTATITYTMGAACFATKLVTILASPGPITGVSPMCLGQTATFTDPDLGGVWSSGAPAVATVVPVTGFVTAVSVGGALIRYTMPNGCFASFALGVNISSPIAGPKHIICEGEVISLTESIVGGTWSSSNTAIATVSIGGVVIGVSAGVAIISYTIPGSPCIATYPVTVSPFTPAPISGPTVICGVGTAITYTYTDATPGGTWSSIDPISFPIDPVTGVATALATGVQEIVYTSTCGGAAYLVVTVALNPAPITGTPPLCTGSTATLTDVVTGGTWSSSAPGIASINPTTGVVTGIAGGTATISYTNICGSATTVVTVMPTPLPIMGTANVCEGAVVILTDATSGGVWSASNSNATVSSLGAVTGVTAGTCTITYSLGPCFVTMSITVDPMPSEIHGVSALCVGQSVTFGDDVSGGSWTSSNTAVATVGLMTGIVTGVSAGTATITYTLAAGLGFTGCFVTYEVTVNPTPTITGSTSLCVSTTTLTVDIPGGSWSTSDPSIATVDAFGVMTAYTNGVVDIYYTLPTECYAVITITVSMEPSICEYATYDPIISNYLFYFTSSSPTAMFYYNVYDWTGAYLCGPVGPTSVPVGGVSFVPYLYSCTPDGVGMCIVGVTDGGCYWGRYIDPLTGLPTGTEFPHSCCASVNPGLTFKPGRTTGIVKNSEDVNSNLSIVPNPNNGRFFIYGVLTDNGNTDEVTVEVMDILGKIIYHDVIRIPDGIINSEVVLNENVSNGVYLVRLKNHETTQVLRFVLNK